MATVRALQSDSWSISKSWKDYFICCYVKRNSSTADRREALAKDETDRDVVVVNYGSGNSTEYASWSVPGGDNESDLDELGKTDSHLCKQRSVAESGILKHSTISSESTTTCGWKPNGVRRSNEDLTIDSSFRESDENQDKLRGLTMPRSGLKAATAVEANKLRSLSTTWLSRPSAASVQEQDSLCDSHLFDVSDLQQLNRTPSDGGWNYGAIRLTFVYKAEREKMTVTVHEAQDIPSHERGGSKHTQVRLLLLPVRKIRLKTKVKDGENPKFEETFDFRAPSDVVGSMGLRIRLYGCERLRREHLIGETTVDFHSIKIGADFTRSMWVPFEPRSTLSHGDSMSDVSSIAPSESGSSTNLSLQHGGPPELMIGLAYNGDTGRMSVDVLQGTNFKNMATRRPPDTYVKLALMAPNGEKITHSKTSVRRGQPNPLFNEEFVFQVAKFQLPDVSLLISVFTRRSLKRKEMIGWFTMGNKSSSEEDQRHWTVMIGSKGEKISRWHALLEP